MSMNNIQLANPNITPESLIHCDSRIWIFWKDLDGRFLGCNDNMAKAIDLKHPSEIIGLCDYDLRVTKEESDYFIRCDQIVMRANASRQFNDTFTRDGIRLDLTVLKSPLMLDGEIIGSFGISFLRNKHNRSATTLSVIKAQYQLTERELEVIQLFVRGKTAKEIAILLQISNRTVETHIKNIKVKTHCKKRSMLIDLMFPYFHGS